MQVGVCKNIYLLLLKQDYKKIISISKINKTIIIEKKLLCLFDWNLLGVIFQSTSFFCLEKSSYRVS